MSVIQVSDDGFYRSLMPNPSETNVATFESAEASNSVFVLTAGWKEWFRDAETDDYDAFLHKVLAGDKDCFVYINEKGHWAITKKYPMQRFVSQAEADKVLADFGRIVKENTGIELIQLHRRL